MIRLIEAGFASPCQIDRSGHRLDPQSRGCLTPPCHDARPRACVYAVLKPRGQKAVWRRGWRPKSTTALALHMHPFQHSQRSMLLLVCSEIPDVVPDPGLSCPFSSQLGCISR